MPDQLMFNSTLNVLGGTPLSTSLTGTLEIDYGQVTTVTGSLNLSAAGSLGAQVYSSLAVTQIGTTVGGLPIYALTGTNGATSIAIEYTGQLPTTAAARVTDAVLNSDLATGAGAVAAAVVCFVAGTLIRTPRGETPIENLRVGETVVTAAGKERRIVWTGSRRVECRRCAEPRAVWPIRIARDAFGEGAPFLELLVSPGHALAATVLDEVLVPATVLVNGSTGTQIEVDEVVYWHVELDAHDILFANGLPTESYINVGNRAFFGIGTGDVDPLRTPAVLADYCRPYVAEGILVRALRSQLQARATRLGWRLDAAPFAGLHLMADGRRIAPDIEGLTARFELPAGASDVWLVSETSVPAHVHETWDTRRLGVCVKAIRIGHGADERQIPMDDPSLCVGFHFHESVGETAQRWTAGRARVPAALWADASGDVVLSVELAAPALPRWIAPAGAGARGEPPRPRLAAVAA